MNLTYNQWSTQYRPHLLPSKHVQVYQQTEADFALLTKQAIFYELTSGVSRDKHIWTRIDKSTIRNGYHLPNIGYCVTKQPWGQDLIDNPITTILF